MTGNKCIYPSLKIFFGVTRMLRLCEDISWYILGRLPVHSRAKELNTFTPRDNFESTVYPWSMFLVGGSCPEQKPTQAQREHANFTKKEPYHEFEPRPEVRLPSCLCLKHRKEKSSKVNMIQFLVQVVQGCSTGITIPDWLLTVNRTAVEKTVG